MSLSLDNVIRDATNADDVFHIEDVQSLWSGYGKIMRYGLTGSSREKIVLKHIKLPESANHPRGWNTDRSHQRKIQSYEVESAWYKTWSKKCDETCRIPSCITIDSCKNETLIILEDLDASGFSVRKKSASLSDIEDCLSWLANFHAIFLGESPEGLWSNGTYWHLETRPDELLALKDSDLKTAAKLIDRRLNQANFKTFVHGDAKLANFCFPDARYPDPGGHVAAVDFQYVGGGCGMKDVAYFIGSCLYEEDCETYEESLLDYYFKALNQAIAAHNKDIDCQALEREWRDLYPVAWADFHRFVKGWNPGHWKIHGYSERISREVARQLLDQE